MPQSTWVGPLVFILLINDLSTNCIMHKFVDDVTLSEIIKKHDCSNMSAHFNDVVEWSDDNLMNINFVKTKEILSERINKDPPLNISVKNNVIERVSICLNYSVYILTAI